MRLLNRPLPAAAAILAATNTAALAHVGDHSHMSLAEMTNHLWANLDHRFTVIAVAMVLVLAGVTVLGTRRKGRGRGTPAT